MLPRLSSNTAVVCAMQVFAGYDTPRAVFPSIVGLLGVWSNVHSRCFSCDVCPEPPASDRQLVHRQGVSGKEFFSALDRSHL